MCRWYPFFYLETRSLLDYQLQKPNMTYYIHYIKLELRIRPCLPNCIVLHMHSVLKNWDPFTCWIKENFVGKIKPL